MPSEQATWVWAWAEVVEELVTLHRGMLFEWRISEGGFPLAQRGRRMAEHLLEGMRG